MAQRVLRCAVLVCAVAILGIPLFRYTRALELVRPTHSPNSALSAPTGESLAVRTSESSTAVISAYESGLLQAVEERLPELFAIASRDAESFGMGPGASPEKARLLLPYQIYTFVAPGDVSVDTDSDLLSCLEPTGSWEVPVDWGDGPGALVHVSRAEDSWRVRGVGGRNSLAWFKRSLASMDLDSYLTSVEWHSGSQVYFVAKGLPPVEVVIAKTAEGLVAVEQNASSLPLPGDRAPSVVPALGLTLRVFAAQ